MKNNRSVYIAVLFLFTIGASTKEGCGKKSITIVLQNNKSDVFDAHLDYFEGSSENNNSNTGAANELPVYSWTVYGTPVTGRALLKFSLKSIPENYKIASAKLSLYGYPEKFTSFALPQGNSGDNVVVLQRVTEDWNESKVTWNNKPASTTEGQIELPLSTSQWNYDVIDADVTGLINQMRATNNYGFNIQLRTEETYRSIGFLSSEYADPAKRPRLEIICKK